MLPSQLEIRTKVRLLGSGDYMFRVRAYGEQAGDEPVKMAIYLDNKLVRNFELKRSPVNRSITKAGSRPKGANEPVPSYFSTTIGIQTRTRLRIAIWWSKSWS